MIVFYIAHTIMKNCLNCNTVLVLEQNYCSNCGQKVPTHRLDLHDISHDAVHYFTHADKGIFQLLKALITKTGLVAKEYVEGKRKKYFPPLNFFLIVAAIYVLVSSNLQLNQQLTTATRYQTQQANHTKTLTTEQQEAIKKAAPVSRFFAKYSNFVAMFAAPFISLFIWLIYFRGAYNYTEHLVANLYLIGFTNLVRAVLFTPAIALLDIPASAKTAQLVFVSFEIIYRSIFYYQFMGQYNNTGKLKSVGVAFLTQIFWWAFIYTIIAIVFTVNK